MDTITMHTILLFMPIFISIAMRGWGIHLFYNSVKFMALQVGVHGREAGGYSFKVSGSSG